jgi:PAS domain S-box-containing protein
VSKELNILVVEGDGADSMLLEAMLLKSGLNISSIQHCTSLAGVLDDVSAKETDIILLDLNLPDSHGFETLRQVVRKYARKTIIAITDDYDEEFVLTAISKGAHGCLFKGQFDNRGLNRAVRYSLERKTNQERAAYHQTILETLVAALSQRIVLKDCNSVIIYCNDKYAASLGLTPEQVIGKTDYDLYPMEIAERHIAGDKEVIASGDTADYFIEYAENHQLRYVRVLKVAVVHKDGHSEGVLCVLEDFTERIQIQESLKHSERRYSRLLSKSVALYNSWKVANAN